MIAALFLAAVIGVPLGLIAAVRKDRVADYIIRFASLFALSTPQFFLGLVLQIVFSMMLRLAPLGGRFPFIPAAARAGDGATDHRQPDRPPTSGRSG